MWGFNRRGGLWTPWFSVTWGPDINRRMSFCLTFMIAPQMHRSPGMIVYSAWAEAAWNWPWHHDPCGRNFVFYAGECLPEPREETQ